MLSDVAHAENFLQTMSVSALAFQAWETCITFDDEVELIWTMSHTAWVKWLFLFLRYVPFAGILSSRFVNLSLSVDRIVPTEELCRRWFIWEIVVSQAVALAMEATLMIRVYALFHRSCRTATALSAMFAVAMFIHTAGMVSIFQHVVFDEMCLVERPPKAVYISMLAILVAHTVIMAMTIVKYCQIMRASTPHRRTPLFSLVLRDATLAFVSIAFIIITRAVMLLEWNNVLSSLGFSWSLAVASCAVCVPYQVASLQRLIAKQNCTGLQIATEYSAVIEHCRQRISCLDHTRLLGGRISVYKRDYHTSCHLPRAYISACCIVTFFGG
ncbi:hypothetical protein PLICRDRAFT_34811 [Plicaturopsis crispa FD-325 SS-3]|nr:hypothetical protein PLICRDRAFT_34811 [Plicaturopsis crispa FD-325 SS-3]